jgi:FtsP/CotA-like multicopper oxidase with cupredoxin domain
LTETGKKDQGTNFMNFQRRDIYIKIEPLNDYSPLAPVICARRYGRDCMFNEGHESGRIPPNEIIEATVDALVYREYFDGHYTVPNTAKLVGADVNEPLWNRRVPGAILYAKPGERLHFHVLNGDLYDCHSFHLHGLRYGIDSDGAWPHGVSSRDGRRSDEIRPGETWTYIFDATTETIGAWAFHDHVRNVQQNVNRGLFGGLIVRDPSKPCPNHEVPIFIHQMQATAKGYFFRSDEVPPGAFYDVQPPTVFDHSGVCNYYCAIHGTSMSGRIDIVPAGGTPPTSHTVIMKNLSFGPPITIHVGDTVRWENQEQGGINHVVFSPGGGKSTFCLNGRAYVGNTPTIAGDTGESLRWYVFNLDLASMWHNFHPHSVRWQLPVPPGGASDVHGLSPVETFVTDTLVPPAMRLPCVLEDLQCDPPSDACRVRIKGDFLFHCHVEEHMMQGLAGLVRGRQYIWLTDPVKKQVDIELPYDDGTNECPYVDVSRCHPGEHKPTPDPHHQPTPEHGDMPMPVAGGMSGMPQMDLSRAASEGLWELLPCNSQVLAVHGAVLHTGKVFFMAGSGNSVPKHAAHEFRAVIWDYENGGFKTLQTSTDIFCTGHSFLPDGRLVIAGGTLDYQSGDADKGTLKGFTGACEAYLLDPLLEDFIRVASMRDGRWYPSLITLADGRVLATSGLSTALQAPDAKGNQFSKINEEHEIYSESASWVFNGTLVKNAQMQKENSTWPLYPHLFVIRDGRLFYSGGHVFGSNNLAPGWLDSSTNTFTEINLAPETNVFDPNSTEFYLGRRDQSASVLLPPAQAQRVMVMGGGGVKDLSKPLDGNTNPEIGIAKVHVIDLLAPKPAFAAARSMHLPRIHLNAVLLPDRTVLVSGGEAKLEAASEAALQAEIYHPSSDTWTVAAKASVPRMYHSIAMLLPDGRVITAGSNPESADPGGGDLRLELYHPPYLFRGPRPFIQSVAQEWQYGATVEIHTPQAEDIQWAQIIRPMATTHSWDSNQRLVDVPFRKHGLCHLEAHVPHEPTIAPPGWYMLFITDRNGIPSVAKWIRLSGQTNLQVQEHREPTVSAVKKKPLSAKRGRKTPHKHG